MEMITEGSRMNEKLPTASLIQSALPRPVPRQPHILLGKLRNEIRLPDVEFRGWRISFPAPGPGTRRWPQMGLGDRDWAPLPPAWSTAIKPPNNAHAPCSAQRWADCGGLESPSSSPSPVTVAPRLSISPSLPAPLARLGRGKLPSVR